MHRRRDPGAGRRAGERRPDVGGQQRAAIEHRNAVDQRQHHRALEAEHVLRRHAADDALEGGQAALDLLRPAGSPSTSAPADQMAAGSSAAAAARRCCPRCRAAPRPRPRPAARRASARRRRRSATRDDSSGTSTGTGALVASGLGPGLGVADDDGPRPPVLEHRGEVGAAARGRQDDQAAVAQRRQAGDQEAEARGAQVAHGRRIFETARQHDRGRMDLAPGPGSLAARRRPAGPDGLARPPGACRGAAASMRELIGLRVPARAPDADGVANLLHQPREPLARERAAGGSGCSPTKNSGRDRGHAGTLA